MVKDGGHFYVKPQKCSLMLINVKTALPISFFFLIFFHQKMRNWYSGKYKKVGEKYSRDLTGDTKNVGSKWTPICT